MKKREQAALAIIAQGLPLIRLKPKSKVPAETGWRKKVISSSFKLKAVIRNYPDDNFGIPTGSESELVVIDPDGKKGKRALAKLEAKNYKLPTTVTVITPGDGLHLYYKYSGANIGNSVSKLGPHIDVRGTGGYVVAAGSTHPNGGVYRYATGKALGEVEIAQLPAWVIKKLKKAKTATVAPVATLTGREVARGKRYAEKALELETQRVRKAPVHQRNHTLNSASFRLGQLAVHGLVTSASIQQALGAAAQACGLSDTEIGPTIESGFKAGLKHPRNPFTQSQNEQTDLLSVGVGPKKKLTASLAKLRETDVHNAERFVRRFGHLVLWTPGIGWLVFDGKCWVPDMLHQRVKLARQTMKLIRAEAPYLRRWKERAGRLKFADLSLSKGAIDRMLQLAQPDVSFDDNKLDADPDLLNVRNGTLDLKTGQLQPHNPADLISRCIEVDYVSAALSRRFRRFILRACGGNKDYARFLKKAVGYTLTGSNKEQILFFLHGPTHTGKSTFINLIRDLLGPYAVHTSIKTFLVKQYDNEIPVDEARMKGARMVTAIENNVNQQLDEAKIKGMTGGDKMVGRFMRQNPFEYMPEFKLWIGANDLPKVRATDDAIWNRFVVLPFKVQFADESEEDKSLPAKLREDYEAILAWAVRGAKLWMKEGLADKHAFDSVKAEWRALSDTVGRFYYECCEVVGPSEKVQSSVLYERYKQWCKGLGEIPATDKVFKARLLELNVPTKKDRVANWWLGLRLKE
jgi:putative DNA primase/helicase